MRQHVPHSLTISLFFRHLMPFLDISPSLLLPYLLWNSVLKRLRKEKFTGWAKIPQSLTLFQRRRSAPKLVEFSTVIFCFSAYIDTFRVPRVSLLFVERLRKKSWGFVIRFTIRNVERRRSDEMKCSSQDQGCQASKLPSKQHPC